jgi:hypothetical protein
VAENLRLRKSGIGALFGHKNRRDLIDNRLAAVDKMPVAHDKRRHFFAVSGHRSKMLFENGKAATAGYPYGGNAPLAGGRYSSRYSRVIER